MDQRNTNSLVPPAIDRRNDGAQVPEPQRLTTADLASAGGATTATAATTATTAPAPTGPPAPHDGQAQQQVEQVEAARTERVPAPETRIEPGAMPGAAAPRPPAREVDEPGAKPAPSTASPAAGAPTPGAARDEQRHEDEAPLFAADEAQRYRDRWDEVQAGFVDDPRHAVEQADHMVAEVMKRLAEVFAGQRKTLEQQWSKGEDISTEDLRVTLRRYRSFFSRLLSI